MNRDGWQNRVLEAGSWRLEAGTCWLFHVVRSTISNAPIRALSLTLFLGIQFLASSFQLPGAEAAVSQGSKYRLETGDINQGGGTMSSTKYTTQETFGEASSGTRQSSSQFGGVPGFIGAVFSALGANVSPDLDIRSLRAITGPLGTSILPQTWQRSNSPTFLWEPSLVGGNQIAGYSYAIDAQPGNAIQTTATSFDVASSTLKALLDGKHTFSVQAIGISGVAGRPISFEIWIDTTPPQVTAYAPISGALLATKTPTVSATMSDVNSGVDASTIHALLNGSALSVSWDPAKGIATMTGGDWREGTNSLELHVADIAGNAQTPLVWTAMVDTIPPTGTVTINGGASMTTSVYVTLGLNASDATSGVARILVSNEELSGYVQEPYVSVRDLWKLTPIRGTQHVYVKFIDRAGNISAPVSAAIDLGLLAPKTIITGGPAGVVPQHDATFSFMCPEGDCVFSYAFDNEPWSAWSPLTSATKIGLPVGNHYFRVKAAKEVNGQAGIQPDEEDPAPADRTWVVGVEPALFGIPKGPPIKLWRLE